MDAKRLANLVLGDLTLENLKIQEKLESAINSTTLDVEMKLITIKQHLTSLTLNELSAAKFQQLLGTVPPPATNNDTLNQTQNG